jgi:uncharacterized protein (DUF433 family)
LDHQEAIERYIEDSPYGKADARLLDYGVHVWAVIGQLKVERWDIDAVARSYDLPREAVEAAIAYYQANKNFIDARLLLNSA